VVYLKNPDGNDTCCDCAGRPAPCDSCCEEAIVVMSTNPSPLPEGSFAVTPSGITFSAIGNHSLNYTGEICVNCPGGLIYELSGSVGIGVMNSHKYPGDASGPGTMTITLDCDAFGLSVTGTGVNSSTTPGHPLTTDFSDSDTVEIFVPFCDDEILEIDYAAVGTDNFDDTLAPDTFYSGAGGGSVTFTLVGPPP